MNRRGFLGLLAGGLAAGAAVRTWPFRVYSFPTDLRIWNPIVGQTVYTTSLGGMHYYEVGQLIDICDSSGIGRRWPPMKVVEVDREAQSLIISPVDESNPVDRNLALTISTALHARLRR